jgi:hypothetical protein
LVTITHPYHPLRGHQVEVVGLRRGVSPDLIVRLPDGTHAAVALRSTDFASSSSSAEPLAAEPPLLALEGLRQLAQGLNGFRQQGRLPPPSA